MSINELDLKQFLKLFWEKKVFIIIMVIVFAVIGVIKIKHFTTPVYQATGKMICSRSEEAISEGTTVTVTELSTTSSLAETYAELIKSDLVVGKVIENLGLDMTISQLKNSIEMTPLTKVYYQVSVKSTDNEAAATIANEFMKVFSEEVKNFYEIDSIHIVDDAKVPMNAINMNVGKSVVIFAAIGGAIAVAIVMIKFVFNNTVTNSEQIKKYTKLTTLAQIPKYSGDEDLITVKDSKSPYAESVKILRTNLQYMYDKENLKTVGITSSLPGEGKSWLTANLGVAFANSGKKTLIIDADMRRGRQHKIFDVKKVPGLSEFLRVGSETTGFITVKGKRVVKTGIGGFLGTVNKYVKIDNIPAVSNMIYKEEYITMNVDNNAKSKALKMDESSNEQLEIPMENVSKRRGRPRKTDLAKTTKKSVLKITDFVNRTRIDNLYVLPAGRETTESSELLATEKFADALNQLKDEFDIILVDTPPVSVVADGFLISRMVDTNMIVLKHGNTEINELNKIKNNIEEIGGEVIGTVINKTPDAKKKYYNTYYNKAN